LSRTFFKPFQEPEKDKRPVPPDTSNNEFPNIQSGRFQIVELIGAGGAGKVYKAIDTTLDKTVAIKKLHSTNSTDAIRFQREAKLAGSLKHPNVMRVYDFGFTQNEEPYLVLEFVEGKTLDRQLKEQSIPRTVALKIFSQIAAGLSHAHSKGVIHRDIKPGNIILVKSETRVEGDADANIRPLIVDFGLAKLQEENQSLTAPGIGIGTPRYMSPEQIRGTEVDHRSDIYSLGCLMFETLTGSSPFQADSVIEQLEQHLSKQPPLLIKANTKRLRDMSEEQAKAMVSTNTETEFSPSLESIVSKCLKKNVEERYASAEELRTDLLQELQRELTRIAATTPEETVTSQEMLGILPTLHGRNASKTGLLVPISLIATGLTLAAGIVFLLIRSSDPAQKDGFDRSLIPGAKIQESATHAEEADKEIDAGKPSMLARIPETDMSGTYMSKTGYYKIYATNDEELKKQLIGLHVTKIVLSGSSFTPSGFRDAETQYLKSIKCVGRVVDRAILKAFSEPKGLEALEIGGMGDKFNSNDLAVLRGCKCLRQLMISDQQLSDNDFDNIAKLKQLNSLELTSCRISKPDNLTSLARLPNLRSIGLCHMTMSDADVHALAPLRLEYINMNYSSGLTEKGFEELGRMKSLKALDIKETSYSLLMVKAFRRYNKNVHPDRSKREQRTLTDFITPFSSDTKI
jgi:serine/threonine protein kinase